MPSPVAKHQMLRRHLAMEQKEVLKEVQEEALRAISMAAAQAGAVDSVQLEAIARSAEARATVFAEALRRSETAEERQRILESFMRADERDSQERRETGERATDSQRGLSEAVVDCVVAHDPLPAWMKPHLG